MGTDTSEIFLASSSGEEESDSDGAGSKESNKGKGKKPVKRFVVSSKEAQLMVKTVLAGVCDPNEYKDFLDNCEEAKKWVSTKRLCSPVPVVPRLSCHFFKLERYRISTVGSTLRDDFRRHLQDYSGVELIVE